MAKDPGLMGGDIFPTLFVAPGVADYQRKPGGGNVAVESAELVNQARSRLLNDVARILERMSQKSQAFGLASLKLRGGSIAKTKRPRNVFTVDTCPIIGDWGDPGEILVLVHPQGGLKLTETLAKLGERAAKNLINVESFSLVEPSRRLPRRFQQAVQRDILSAGEAHIKIRALHDDLWGSTSAAQVAASLSEITGQEHKPYLHLGPFGIYGVTVRDMGQLASVADLWFVAAMDVMPTYAATDLYLAEMNVERVTLDTSIDVDQLRPVLVFDGGIDGNGPLGPLIYSVEQFEDDAYLDLRHGTGVAALVARRADSSDNVISPRARLIDVRGVPKSKSGHTLTENILVERLDYCAELYGEIAHEWNLSFAMKPGPRQSAFSDIGMYLDNLHKRYGITFYCSPGNCAARTWPPSDAADDYVAPPGDAVCAVTVGASVPEGIQDETGGPVGAPANFSPQGSLIHGVIKPDLTAPGGNQHGQRVYGVQVLGMSGQWHCSAGTSFSTPTVTGAGAELATFLSGGGIVEQFGRETVGQVNLGLIVRALLTHRAQFAEVGLLAGNAPIDNYRGFGELASLEAMLLDPSWRSTSVIYTRLYPKKDLVLDNFPFPESLRKGKLYWGHAAVTMASEPLLDPGFTYEYLRSNVDIHFGIVEYREKVEIDETNGREIRKVESDFHSQISNSVAMIRNESRLVQDEHKWSPVKKFESAPMLRCVGDFWRLRADLLLRDKESDALAAGRMTADELAVDVAIVVSISDPQHMAPVNSQVFSGWRMRGQIPSAIQITPRIPVQWG